MTAARPAALFGLMLVAIYCVFATGADAITRVVAHSFAAPQLFFVSGLVVSILSVLANRASGARGTLRSNRPRTLALRSVLFILASCFYFVAFRHLAFAEVFVFIALVPIFAALLSGPILKETVRWQSWIALCVGASGMILLYPEGLGGLGWPQLSAILGALSGAAAMVLARDISRDDPNSFLQVLYPNLAMAAVMGCALPFVYKPMQPAELALIFSYGILLFIARWVLVLALTQLKAYVVTLLINLQFAFMVLVGATVFGEIPGTNLFAGALVTILAGSYLFFEELFPKKPGAQVLLLRASLRLHDATRQGNFSLTLKS